MHVVNVVGADLDVDDKFVLARHDIEHRLACPDDAARGLEPEIENGAGDRGGDRGAGELIQALLQQLLDLDPFRLDLRQVVIDLLGAPDLDVDDLQLGLGDRIFCAGDARQKISLRPEKLGLGCAGARAAAVCARSPSRKAP